MGYKPTDIVSRAQHLAHRLFEDRVLVITAKDSMLHRFNEVGTFIWQQLEKPRSAGEIHAAVARHFAGFDPEENDGDVRRFLETLVKKGCVEIARKEP